METQRDTIFIQNLPRGVTTDELRDVFSQIGMIKVRYFFNSFDNMKTCVFLR
jgi:RNA recognition motif-containing protein